MTLTVYWRGGGTWVGVVAPSAWIPLMLNFLILQMSQNSLKHKVCVSKIKKTCLYSASLQETCVLDILAGRSWNLLLPIPLRSWCRFLYWWIPYTSDHPCWSDHCPDQHFSDRWPHCGERRTVPSLLYLFRQPARSCSETRLWWGKHHHQEWWWLVQNSFTWGKQYDCMYMCN